MMKRMMTYLKPSSDSISAPTTWPRWEWMSYLSEYINIQLLHTDCIFGETFFNKISERGKVRLQLFQVEFTWWWREHPWYLKHRLKMLIDEQARTWLILSCSECFTWQESLWRWQTKAGGLISWWLSVQYTYWINSLIYATLFYATL